MTDYLNHTQGDQAPSNLRVGKTTRRGFVKLVGGGLGVAAFSGLLAACGDAPETEEEQDSNEGDASSDESNSDSGDGSSTDGSATEEEDPEAEETEDSGGESAEGEPQPGGTFRLGFDTAPEGFDPHAATNFAAMNVYENIYDCLFQFNSDLELEPMLCESYEVVDDTTYQFKLKQGVTFHSGKELTAEDVKYSYERMINPDNAFPRVQWFGLLDTVEADDDYTCTFTLQETFAPFLSYMGMQGAAIVDQETVEEYGDLMSAESANGSGPFKLESYEPDREIRLVKNENYWGEGPYLDEIQWMLQPDEASRVAALRADEVDMIRVFDVQNSMALSEEFPVHTEFVTSRALTIINCRNEPLNNPQVRQAMAYAINRQDFIESAMFGEAEPTGFIPPSDPAAISVDEFETFTQDIDRANQLLEEAGYADGFDLRLVVSPQYAMDVSNAEVLAAQLGEIGITADIQQLEWGTLLDNMRNAQDFDLLNIIFTFQADPDGYTYTYFHSDSSNNYSGISVPELDELIEQGRTTLDENERQEIYAELQRRLADEWVPKFTYFVYYQRFPAQERVKGWWMIPSISYRPLRDVWLEG